jgi:tetratricopeptide (TPR) repeat protein
MSFFDPKNVLTALFALAAVAWAGYAVFFHGAPDKVARAPAPKAANTRVAPSNFALKPSRLLKIRKLLTDGRIDELEALLTGLQKRFEADEIDDREVSRAFDAFATSDPALAGPLDEWNRTRPNSFAAPLARARYFRALAWKARGVRIAAATPKERFAAMRTYLRRARADAIRAYDLRPRLTAAAPTMIQVVYHLREGGVLHERITHLQQQFPCSMLMHWAVLPYLQPRWGGSLKQIDEYTATVARRCPKHKEVLSYREIARAYIDIDRNDRRAAIRRFTAALRQNPWPGYYYSRAMQHSALKERNEALSDFGRAFALNPEHIGALSEIANILFMRGRKKEAMRLWERALALDPYEPDTLIDRAAHLIYHEGNPAAWYEMAIADLEKAKRYFGGDLQKLQRMQSTARQRRVSLKDGIAVLRREYYANPRNEAAFVYYETHLTARFRCSRADEFRALIKHCAKHGHCNGTKVYMLTVTLERLLKRKQCGSKASTAKPHEIQ